MVRHGKIADLCRHTHRLGNAPVAPGDLLFLNQARAQPEGKNLQIEDGWTYFIHGWTRAIAEVFHVEIPTSGPQCDALATIAAETR